MTFDHTLQQGIINKIDQLLQTTGEAHRLIFEADCGYMVLAIAHQNPEIKVYAAAGRALEERLSPAQSQRLYDAGYRRKTAADVFHKTYTLNSLHAESSLLDDFLPIFDDLYMKDPSSLRVKSRKSDWITLDDSHLIQTMQKATKTKELGMRQKLYWSFVRSKFLLALNRKVDRDLLRSLPTMSILDQMKILPGLLEYHISPEINHYRAAVVFSSMQHLENYDIRLYPHVQLSGRVLSSILLQDQFDSVLINPRHSIGGEFYKNELSSIDTAMKTWDQHGKA